MDSMSIAIGALHAAQAGMDIAGNNIANAATEGYHRQKVSFTPAYSSEQNGFLLGGGVDVGSIQRMIDTALEKQISQQRAYGGQANTELDTLSSIEAAFGELTGDGSLSLAIDNFFSSLGDLSANPSSDIMQTQVVSMADAMASQFRALGSFLTDVTSSIIHKAGTTVEQINELTGQIAELNGQIQAKTLQGSTTNNLMDERDARLNSLADLIGIQTIDRPYGVTDVSVGGIWLVDGASTQQLEVTTQENGMLGIAPVGTASYVTEIEGGQLGGYMNLNNTSLASIKDNLDTLAQSIINGVNRYHIQGIGTGGSFTDLVGASMPGTNLSDFEPPVTDGNIYVRVTNTTTGEVAWTAIPVDASADTLSTMAAKLDAVSGIQSQVVSGRLQITSDTGCTFDFIPATTDPVGDSDTSGFLAAAGINTFFTGNTAQYMAVSDFVADSPSRIATSLGADMTDSTNILRLSRLRDEELTDLSEMSIGGYYRKLVADVGSEVSVKQLRVQNIEAITQNLTTQREAASGVDVNDEAARMIVFERMFQASAKYLNTVQSAMDEIMKLL